MDLKRLDLHLVSYGDRGRAMDSCTHDKYHMPNKSRRRLRRPFMRRSDANMGNLLTLDTVLKVQTSSTRAWRFSVVFVAPKG